MHEGAHVRQRLLALSATLREVLESAHGTDRLRRFLAAAGLAALRSDVFARWTGHPAGQGSPRAAERECC
jgi:hypothetical protein